MTAVAKIEPPDVAPISEATAVIQMIERAVLNPAIDIDKMERLLAMQERVMERNAKSAFDDALAAMQPELPIISERGAIKNKDREVQSTYALWEDINEAIKPILSKHRFALSFRTNRAEGMVSVTGILSGYGHREETTIALPVDATGGKNGVQAVGSSTSYGQRYTAKLLLNLTSRGVDDDGQLAGMPGTISQDQADDLRAMLEEVKANVPKFLEYMKVEQLEDIPLNRLTAAFTALEAKRGRS